MRSHQKCPRKVTLKKCPLEFAHFEKKCPRNVIVHEMSPSPQIGSKHFTDRFKASDGKLLPICTSFKFQVPQRRSNAHFAVCLRNYFNSVWVSAIENIWTMAMGLAFKNNIRGPRISAAIFTYLLVVRLLKGCIRSCSELQISVGEADYPVDAT